jgi:hypothetical protein
MNIVISFLISMTKYLSNLREERFILAHGLRPSWWAGCRRAAHIMAAKEETERECFH